jgi:hypothetical protein
MLLPMPSAVSASPLADDQSALHLFQTPDYRPVFHTLYDPGHGEFAPIFQPNPREFKTARREIICLGFGKVRE